MYPLLGHGLPSRLLRWHVNGYTWDPSGPLSNPDQKWPDLMHVTAEVKHCFPIHDRRGVNSPDVWRNFLPKPIADRKVILVDTRQLSNPEKDRGNQERHCIGRHRGITDEVLRSGTGMYLLQSTWEAIVNETKLDPKLVVIDFDNANRHRAVAKGTIMSAMLVEKGIEHDPLHLNANENWKHMRCGGSCSSCGKVDPARATGMAKRAFQGFTPKLEDHDTSDSAYQQRRPLSLSLGPRSAGTAKTTNKIPGVVKVEEEIPNKDPKVFRH